MYTCTTRTLRWAAMLCSKFRFPPVLRLTPSLLSRPHFPSTISRPFSYPILSPSTHAHTTQTRTPFSVIDTSSSALLHPFSHLHVLVYQIAGKRRMIDKRCHGGATGEGANAWWEVQHPQWKYNSSYDSDTVRPKLTYIDMQPVTLERLCCVVCVCVVFM